MRESLQKIIHDFMMILPKSLRENSISCQKVSHELDDWDSLSWLTRIKLRMHILICYKCWNYEKQMQIIHQHFQTHSLEEHNLDERIKDRVIKKHS